MSVIAFNFTKIAAERSGPISPNLKITGEIKILEVLDASLGNQKALNFKFAHETVYAPSTGKIQLHGEVLLLSNEKESKETLESFKQTKTFAPDLTRDVYNTILTRVSVESLIIARDLNLPAPFKLPMVDAVPNVTVQAPTTKAVEKPVGKDAKKK